MPQPRDDLILDRLIHEPGRLAIMTVLSSVMAADFVFLQRTTGLTKGNLSSHLTKLEEAGLVTIEKRFVLKKPNTNVALTPEGMRRVTDHWHQLERLKSLSETPPSPEVYAGATSSAAAMAMVTASTDSRAPGTPASSRPDQARGESEEGPDVHRLGLHPPLHQHVLRHLVADEDHRQPGRVAARADRGQGDDGQGPHQGASHRHQVPQPDPDPERGRSRDVGHPGHGEGEEAGGDGHGEVGGGVAEGPGVDHRPQLGEPLPGSGVGELADGAGRDPGPVLEEEDGEDARGEEGHAAGGGGPDGVGGGTPPQPLGQVVEELGGCVRRRGGRGRSRRTGGSARGTRPVPGPPAGGARSGR